MTIIAGGAVYRPLGGDRTNFAFSGATRTPPAGDATNFSFGVTTVRLATGGYGVAGVAASTNRNRTAQTTVGVYRLYGSTFVVSRQRPAVLETGAFTLVGRAIGARLAAVPTMVEHGAYAVRGGQAHGVRAYVAALTFGAFATVGAAPRQFHAASGGFGAFGIVGRTVTARRAYVVALATGVVSSHGLDAPQPAVRRGAALASHVFVVSGSLTAVRKLGVALAPGVFTLAGLALTVPGPSTRLTSAGVTVVGGALTARRIVRQSAAPRALAVTGISVAALWTRGGRPPRGLYGVSGRLARVTLTRGGARVHGIFTVAGGGLTPLHHYRPTLAPVAVSVGEEGARIIRKLLAVCASGAYTLVGGAVKRGGAPAATSASLVVPATWTWASPLAATSVKIVDAGDSVVLVAPIVTVEIEGA